MLVSGDATTKMGNQDYLHWQCFREDGITPIDSSAATGAILKIKNLADNVEVEYSTTDDPQKFFITDAATSKVHLRPAANEFSAQTTYKVEIIFIDAVGPHHFPNDGYFTLTIIDL